MKHITILTLLVLVSVAQAGNYKSHEADSLTSSDSLPLALDGLRLFIDDDTEKLFCDVFSYRPNGIYRAETIKRTVIDSIPKAELVWDIVGAGWDAQYKQVPKLAWEPIYKADTTWKKVWPDTVEAVPVRIIADTLILRGEK